MVAVDLGPWGQVQGCQDFMRCVKYEETVGEVHKVHIYSITIVAITTTISNTWKVLAGAMEASGRSGRFY